MPQAVIILRRQRAQPQHLRDHVTGADIVQQG